MVDTAFERTTTAATAYSEVTAILHTARCLDCLDTGLLWSTPRKSPMHCTCGASKQGELLFSPAALIFRQRTFDRMARQTDISALEFHAARMLTLWSSATPLKREQLDRTFEITERKSKEVLESLRRTWLLPIGSRKEAPAGSWIIVTESEFVAWSRMFRRTAITQLATLHKVTRANFPRLAGQTSFDFMQQIAQELEEEVLF